MDYFGTSAFSDRVEKLMKQHHAPGIAIAVVQDDTTASVGYGLASIDPPQPCTPDTLFDIASASKSLTAASVALLVADEKHADVQWEAPMSSLLPDDFVLPTKELTEAVTVEDILTHRTGMAPHNESYLGVNAKHPDTAASVTRNLRNLQPAAPLRTKYMYNNMMFTVATHLVEELSGLTFAEYLDKHFFDPLGMSSSSLQPEAARAKGLGDRIATGYLWDEKTQEYGGFQSPDCPEAQGAGSIVTSINDYIRWVRAMMNQQHPITQDVYDGLLKSRMVQNPDHKDLVPLTSATFVGVGWEVNYYRGHMLVIHDGLIAGFSTTHFFLPEFKFGGVLFGNSEGATIVNHVLMYELMDEVLKIPSEQRLDWNETKLNWILSGDERSPQQEREWQLQVLCPGIKDLELLTVPLSTYTGEYWNEAYRGMKVEIKDDELFIDASDRSVAFTLTFEHVAGGVKFMAHLATLLEGGDDPIRAEFKVVNGKALKMGLHLSEELEDYIWFERVSG